MKCAEGLNQIFRLVLNNQTLNVTPEMTPNDIEGWDSMAHLNLIVAIQSRFGINFETKELRKIRTVGDLAQLIDSKTT
jgi:acyl carrier protein